MYDTKLLQTHTHAVTKKEREREKATEDRMERRSWK